MRRTTEHRLFVAGLLLACDPAPAGNETGGAVTGYDGPFVVRDDLSLTPPSVLPQEPPRRLERGRSPARPSPKAHPLNDSLGWAYLQVRETATQVNKWTLHPFDRLGPLIDAARDDESWEHEGGSAWGPYPDPVSSNPLEWIVWWDGSVLDLRVRAAQSDESYQSFWSLDFASSEPLDVTLRFNGGLIQTHPDLGSHVHDEVRQYFGVAVIHIQRPADGTHQVDVAWEEFIALDPTFGDNTIEPAAPLHYRREADGSGEFFVGLRAPYDDDIGFTGPNPDLARIEMQWLGNLWAWSRMEVDEMGSTNPEGDPLYGPLVIHECSDDNSELLWRDITDPYLEVQAEYENGSLADCEGSRPWPAADE